METFSLPGARAAISNFVAQGRGGSPEPPGARAVQPQSGRLKSIAPTSENDVNLPRCPRCDGLMRPGVVWFGEQLPRNELRRIENYLEDGPCDFVIVAGTTATFGYIVDWALRAIASDGELVEVNPEETPLSGFATQRCDEPAAIALPRLVDQLIAQPPKL